jgi:hypothetical protein
MISKEINLEINSKANPPSITGSLSNWEKKNYPSSSPLGHPTSFKLSESHKLFLDQLVKEGKFFSRSAALRYCIQFCIDLETGLAGIINNILEMKK